MTPYFSIILPTYNRAGRILLTIDSVIKQTFAEWELIIVDDGSQDDTKSIVDGINDARIKYFYKENGERGAARNFGVGIASGRFINFFDSDDLMHPWHLNDAYEKLNADQEIKCLSFTYDYYSFDGKYVNTRKGFKSTLNEDIRKSSFIHLNGSFVLRELCVQFPFKEDRNFHISEDWYFFLHLSFHTTLSGVDKPTTKYVLHPDSSMSNMKPEEFITATVYFEDLLMEHHAEKKIFSNIYAELFSMTSLAYALNGRRIKSINFLYKSLLQNPRLIFRKRFYAILKNILYAKRRS